MRSFVSIVATVRNEAASIDGFLASLLGQSRPPDEIVVVDGGSSDGTLAILEQAAAGNRRLVILSAPGTTIARGRNIAIDRARGTIIAVTDAGAIPERDWLERIVRPLEDDRELAVSSGFYVAGGTTWFERCLGTIITPQLAEIDPESFLPSSRSVALRKEWWARVGGYPEWLRHCEDLVFDLDLRRAGASFAFTPDALVTWDSRRSLGRFFRQYFDYARGDGHAHLWFRRHAARYAAYGAGLGLLLAADRGPTPLLVLYGGSAFHFSKFFRRLIRRPPFSTRSELARGLVALPLIVVTGDVAKMLGFPIGLAERAAGSIHPGRGHPPNSRWS